MSTLRRFRIPPPAIPTATAWYLADLGEARGKQELFTRQSPQKLKALREHALIESAVSSNRIEGVEVERSRIGTVVFGKSPLRDRDEEEVRGYRKALDLIHTRGAALPISEATIRQLHALSRGGLGDAGEYKKIENDIIKVLPGGRRRLRFRTVAAAKTPSAMAELMEDWHLALHSRSIHPLVALGAFNLDFLCIHPFRDGNGRTSRLLFLLQCYHLGFEVGRYISLERLIEQNKERYYETLKLSSEGWHDDRHDPWPAINYFLYTLVDAYREFERRVGETASPRGEKTEVRNVSGTDLGRFAVVALSAPIIWPGDNLEEFQNRVAFDGVTPFDSSNRFAILLDPLASGAIGRGMVAGVTPVRLQVDPEQLYDSAAVVPGQSSALRNVPHGPARVLWVEPGVSPERWAIVRLDDGDYQAHVFITSNVPDEDGYYPGEVQRYDTATKTWQTLFECKVVDINQ